MNRATTDCFVVIKRLDKQPGNDYACLTRLKLRIPFWGLAIVLLVINVNCFRENMTNLLPAERGGWVESGKPEIYDRNNLLTI